MTEHTPGPWSAQAPDKDNIQLEPALSYQINGEEWHGLAMVATLADGLCEEAVANARLIAAAPNMLAALQHLAAIAGTGLLHRESLDKQGMVELLEEARVAATRAIAEATGVPHVPTSADAGLEADVAKAEASFLPPEPAFDPAKVRIVRKRFSVTQGEVEVFYDGHRLNQWGDDIRLDDDGVYRGYDDAFWVDVARNTIRLKERCGA